QNEKIREERRAEILAAAIETFAREGFAETSVSAIAKAAGVSHGTVFLYFPTKEDLFRAAVVEPLAQYEEPFFRILTAGEGTPLERIERFVRAQVLACAGQESYMRLVHYVLGLRRRFPNLAEQIFGFSRRQVQILGPVISEGQAMGQLAPGNPFAIATTYFAWLNGASLVHLTPASDPFWEQAIGYAMRIFAPVPSTKEG
ncbi:MAG TPA: TetR/AcrR family transcriptional regulator, partial [Symbiobacteriaceae bacterium]|nr:TetR/AcrR family transcriptional regulator [Symbiobacteriaceae bacterium]